MKTTCDFLVIGSGIAGLSFAIRAAQYGSVVMITKKCESESNTNYAQGGIACVLDNLDSFESHISDTLIAGAGLCNRSAVETLVTEGPERIRELLEWGVKFSRTSCSRNSYQLDLGKEGGHSAHRIVHAHDLTGREVERVLLNIAQAEKRITMFEDHCAVELITNHHLVKQERNNRCCGAYVLNTVRREISCIRAKVTCLSTGGAGRIYLHTTNPAIATGDGIAMAYRAGATIANMEFIQFHPTTLYHDAGHSFLISEALRGFGAVLKDAKGHEFMKRYHPQGSLAPRDIVARAIDREMKTTGAPCVFLDIRHSPAAATRKHFPNIYKRFRELGIDITRDLIPVVPAAHYLCGGITVDRNGQSSIPHLLACGEVSCTGVHGANRLASNSLLEALVFARRAADTAGASIKKTALIALDAVHPWDDSGTHDIDEWVLLSHNIEEIQRVMWDYVGIVRSNLRLARALRRIKFLQNEIEEYYKRTRITPPLLELRNMVTTASLIVQSAIKRHESRGLHYTTDYPQLNDKKQKHDTLIKNPAA